MCSLTTLNINNVDQKQLLCINSLIRFSKEWQVCIYSVRTSPTSVFRQWFKNCFDGKSNWFVINCYFLTSGSFCCLFSSITYVKTVTSIWLENMLRYFRLILCVPRSKPLPESVARWQFLLASRDIIVKDKYPCIF